MLLWQQFNDSLETIAYTGTERTPALSPTGNSSRSSDDDDIINTRTSVSGVVKASQSEQRLHNIIDYTRAWSACAVVKSWHMTMSRMTRTGVRERKRKLGMRGGGMSTGCNSATSTGGGADGSRHVDDSVVATVATDRSWSARLASGRQSGVWKAQERSAPCTVRGSLCSFEFAV